MAQERYSNITVGSTVRLRFWSYNRTLTDVDSIEKVEIYSLIDNVKTLLQTVEGSSVVHEETGKYYVDVELIDPVYCVGTYIDEWHVNFEVQENEACQTARIEQVFEIKRDLWFTTPTPLVHDFTFSFRPNKMKKGTKQYIIVNVIPNTPTASTLEQYYQAIIATAPLKISIQQECGPCVPAEEDLRLVVDADSVELREGPLGYYFLDTSDLDTGIYDVWFEMAFGESYFISPRNQLQIY